jgi:hypothetical protein
MNLSCGKCRCVRPFSGEPPKCDTCGWVCTPIDPNEATDTEYWQHLRKVRQGEVPSSALPLPESPQAAIDRVAEAAGAFLKFVGVGIVFVIGAYYANYYLQSDADRAASDYNVPADKVTVEPKPHGCEYNDAPLGEKHCHFEKVVDVDRECDHPNCKVRAVYVSWRKVSE